MRGRSHCIGRWSASAGSRPASGSTFTKLRATTTRRARRGGSWSLDPPSRAAPDVHRSSRTINTEKIASENNLAERKFGYERELHDYRRRVEFAEEVLASFYKLKDTIREIRGPFSYGDEGATRNRREFGTEGEARSRDGFYVPIARMNKHKDFLSEVISKKYRAQAVFQRDIGRAFRTDG